MTSNLTIQSARLQLERVRRHYEHSIRTYDEISLLDLAHSLRIWCDMKGDVVAAAPDLASTSRFKYAVPTKKAMATVRGHQYVIAHMPEGVRTFAHSGEFGAWNGLGTDCYVSWRLRRNDNGSLDVSSYGFCDPTPKVIKTHVETATTSRGNFNQWLGAETIRLAYPGEGKALIKLQISREVMIRRVANTMGASHPAGGNEEAKSQFDLAIQYLMKHRIAGLPLPYLLILKVAQDLVETVPDLLPSEQH